MSEGNRFIGMSADEIETLNGMAKRALAAPASQVTGDREPEAFTEHTTGLPGEIIQTCNTCGASRHKPRP